MKLLLAAVCAAGATAAVAAGRPAEIVILKIDEEAGFDRVNEPVTMGVPLPEGKVDDAAKIVLLDATGTPVPCQVFEVVKWLDGKSVRWVQLTWNQSVKAKASQTVTVALADQPQTPARTMLSAELKDNVATVQTGYVKFVVRGRRFNGIDAAWFDPTGTNTFAEANQIIVSGHRGGSTVLSPDVSSVKIENRAFQVDVQPREYRSLDDPNGTVVIEEQGLRRVVLKATGRHLDEQGRKALDYTVRFYVYADSPVIRVSHTFVCAQGQQVKDLVFLSGLRLTLPTRLAGGAATFGSEGSPVSATAPARIFQPTSDAYAITEGLKTLAEGKGKSTKPVTTGWMDLSAGDLGLAVGVKWFWQMFPKAIAVRPDGLVEVSLYPSDADQPLEVYLGQSRTHYLTLVFHDGKTKASALKAVFAGQNRPLYAWAPPKYYCRDTHCFGYSVESDERLFGDDFAKVKEHDAKVLGTLKAAIAAVDSRTRNGEAHESYGVYAWGDMYHWNWRDGGAPSWDAAPFHTDKWRLSWEGNYYDFPHAMLMGFIRTGDKLYLERFIPNAIQIGDVHTCNWHPEPSLVGACRYCPPRNHMAVDDGQPYVSSEYNHVKSQSVFAYYYLTGDRRVREQCLLQANSVLTNRAADSGWAPRGLGAQIGGLWNAYELTLDRKYLVRMKDLAYRGLGQFKSGRYAKANDFTSGIANEGLCYYYWVTGDPAVIDTFKAVLPTYKVTTNSSTMALGSAMTYRVTGDERFRALAWKAIGRERETDDFHGAGEIFRSTHFALFFLSEASKGWKPFVQSVLETGGPKANERMR